MHLPALHSYVVFPFIIHHSSSQISLATCKPAPLWNPADLASNMRRRCPPSPPQSSYTVTSYQYLRPSSPLAVTAAILARTRRQDLSPHTPRRARGEESLLPPAFIHQRSIEQAAESQLPPPSLRSTNLARPDTRTARELSKNKHLIPSLWYVNHCPEGVSASGA